MNTPRTSTKLFPRAQLTVNVVALLFGLASTTLAQTPETGTISGFVVNETTSAPLQGAAVSIDDTKRFHTLTGADGSFRLTHVPAGERTLIVEYTGLTPKHTSVTVRANEQNYVGVELTSEIYSLEAFTVSTVREGQAAAINEQRHASNVVSVVSTDAYGNVADTNLGNLLLKLPGISAERDEAEAYQVTVRGINADLNSVSVDGTLLASATSRGSGRAFEVDKVSTNSIESIEVIKSPTPDMDADSIGGKINLRTKSGFDNQGRRIRYSIGSNVFLQRYRNPSIGEGRDTGLLDFARAEAHPSGSVNYSDVLGKDKRFAIVLNASFNRTFSPRTALRLGYEDNPPEDGIAILNDFQTTEDDILLDRLGLGGKLTFKLSPNTTLFLSALYNDFNDDMSQHKFRLGDTDLVGTATETVQDLAARSEYEMETRTRTVTTGMVQVGGRTDWRDYEMDYDLSHSQSYATDARKNLSIRHQNVTFRIDSSASRYFPTIEQIGGPDVADYDYGKVNYLDRQLYENWDEVTAGKFNIKRSFDTRYPTYLKTGFRYRAQEKRQDRMKPRWAYRGPDDVSGFLNGVNDDNLNRWRDDGRRFFPVEGRYQRWVWPDTAAAHQELDEHPERFIYNAGRAVEQNLKDDHMAGEKIYATYLMGSIKTGKLSTVAGLRFERTETYGTNPSTDESYDKTDPRRWAKSQSISGGYNNTFPGLHLRYEVTPKLLLRASASTSIGRPSFTRLFPGFTVNDDLEDGDDEDDRSVRLNNPNLKPQFSDNYDLSAEYYFRGVGVVSVGVFRKDITDFNFERDSTIGAGPDNGFDGLYEGYKLTTRENGGWAKVEGLELNYEQQLTFLPSFLNGFGIYANGTFLRTQGTYDGDEVVNDLQGFTKRNANGGISYIKHGYTIRASVNYNGQNLRNYNTNPMELEYMEARTTVNLSVKYSIPRTKMSVFVDVNNLTNAMRPKFQGYKSRQLDTQILGMRLAAGLTGEF